MATLQEIWTYCESHALLRQRFAAACIKSAWDVMNEDPGTTNHANRLALDKKILLDPNAINDRYYLYFMSNASVQTNGEGSADNDLLYVVASFFDLVANAEAA